MQPFNPPPTSSEPIGPSGGLNTPVDPARLLTCEEVAERWQVTTAQVYRLAREGASPVVRIGRYRRFRAASVEAWEQAGGGSANE
jgi:excisionase family DNA binding protein